MYEKVKRLIDFTLALIGLIVLSPLFLIISICIKVDSRGQVLFKQKRVGIDKNYFQIYKFRTMRADTPRDIPTHLMKNPGEYITKVGVFLRRTSLDEIPQIINILKGDMAIVGPRPALWNQDDLIAEREKYGVNDIRPGLTGWAQINGRDELDIPEKAKFDGYYRQHMSFLLDLRCFFGTFTSVFSGDGIVEGGTPTASKEKKKLLIVTNHSYMLYQFRRELILNLLEKYDVILSMPFNGHEKDFADMGCRCIETEVDRRGINPAEDIHLLKVYSKLIEEERPEKVITYSIKPNIYAGIICRIKGVEYCVNVQGLGTAFQSRILASLVTIMYREALKGASIVFFENRENAQLFLKRRIVDLDRIVVLKGAGVNLEHYEVCPYPDNKIVHFLYLGRIMKEKGMDELFYAVRRLNAECPGSFVLDLVGFYEDEYRDKVEQLEKEGIVHFWGFQEETRPFYESCSCVVLPSYHEGMSNVLLEAASMGRPVITSDIPGCREAVDDGVSGYLCKAKDQTELYLRLREFVELDSDRAAAMGKAAREKMEKEFDKKAIVRKTIHYIEK